MADPSILSGEPRHFPIVIVGAGPTGLTIANLLGVYGVTCLLIERNEGTVTEPRAVSIDDESLRTVQALGLIKDILPKLAVDYGSHYLTPSGTCFSTIAPKSREYGYPRRNAFIQPELESILRKGLERFEHVHALFGHEVTNISQDSERVSLSVRAKNGEENSVYCDYLVGSDGGRSATRTAIGSTLVGSTFNQKWLIVDLKDTKDRFRQTRVYCDPARPAISLPGPYQTRRFEFLLHPHEREQDMEKIETVRSLLRDHGPDENAEIIRKKTYTFHARRADKWRVGRIFLTGDAAHLTPPFAGQGMNSGLRDSFNISWKLAAVVKGTENKFLLDSYETERSDHAWSLIEMALLLGHFMIPPTRFRAWLMQSSLRALNIIPPVSRYVSEMRYKPKPRFINGYFIPDGRKVKHTLVGRMFPQPMVENNDGEMLYLDEALGHGMVLIVFHTDPKSVLDQFNQPFWESCNIRKIGITPRDYNAVDGNSYRDLRGEMANAMKHYRNTAILLRPDRYVAATISNAPTTEQLDSIRSLFTPAEK